MAQRSPALAESLGLPPRLFTSQRPTLEALFLHLTGRNSLRVVELGLELAAALHHLYPAQFQLELTREMFSNDQLLAALRNGTDPRRLVSLWRQDLQRFSQLRARYLLY